VASFDRSIPPGGEGKITLKVHTKGYEGEIYKSAMVNTNDPELNVVNLWIKAFVKVPIYLSSRYVYLSGVEGEEVTKEVQIRSNLDKPLILTPGQSDLDRKLIYTIDETIKGREFQIRITAKPGLPQTYYGFLRLKTNYPEDPEITIGIRGRVTAKKDER
jgi:hypothetical protein